MSDPKKDNIEFNNMLDVLNNPVKKKLRSEFTRTQRQALKMHQETGEIDEELYIEHRTRLEQIAYDGFVKSQNAAAIRQLRKLKKDGVTDQERREIVGKLKIQFQEWAFMQGAASATAMAETTKNNVNWLVSKFTEADQQKEKNGILDIIRLARKEAIERSIWRSFIGSLAIVHGGANKGQFDAAEQVERSKGWEFVKIWVTRRDDKVRDTHRPMDMQKIKKGELFKVPRNDGGFDMMRYPGDRNASIGNWINCRCSTDLQKEKTDG